MQELPYASPAAGPQKEKKKKERKKEKYPEPEYNEMENVVLFFS